MALVEPDKKDPYGLAGKRGKSPFSSPRFRKIHGPPLIPRWAKIGIYNFIVEIWYSKTEAPKHKKH